MKYHIANIMDSGENITGEVYWVCGINEDGTATTDRMIFKAKDHTKESHNQAILNCIDWVEQKEAGNSGFSLHLGFNHNPIKSRQFMKELREKHPDSFKQDPNVSNLPPALETPQLPHI